MTQQALNWAIESISAMIEAGETWEGTHIDPDHMAGLVNLEKQMLAYRKKRFGWRYEPTIGAHNAEFDACVAAELRRLEVEAKR